MKKKLSLQALEPRQMMAGDVVSPTHVQTFSQDTDDGVRALSVHNTGASAVTIDMETTQIDGRASIALQYDGDASFNTATPAPPRSLTGGIRLETELDGITTITVQAVSEDGARARAVTLVAPGRQITTINAGQFIGRADIGRVVSTTFFLQTEDGQSATIHDVDFLDAQTQVTSETNGRVTTVTQTVTTNPVVTEGVVTVEDDSIVADTFIEEEDSDREQLPPVTFVLTQAQLDEIIDRRVNEILDQVFAQIGIQGLEALV